MMNEKPVNLTYKELEEIKMVRGCIKLNFLDILNTLFDIFVKFTSYFNIFYFHT